VIKSNAQPGTVPAELDLRWLLLWSFAAVLGVSTVLPKPATLKRRKYAGLVALTLNQQLKIFPVKEISF
jgi:hypothetical protein